MFLRFGSKRGLNRIALVGSHKALANTSYRVYTNMRGSDFEYFINEKWLFAPEEHPVCSKIRG